MCVKHYYKMDFINRIPELNRINHLLDNKDSMLLILYERRRLGKTRLLQQIKNENVIHYIADQSEAPLQIAAFSRVADRHIKGFDSAICPVCERQKENSQGAIPEKTT